MIDFLLSKKKEAQMLRSIYVFKIIPVLNPDGVIHGNYRCSLLGVDLNRRWKNPSKVLHPTIYHTKQLLKMLQIERGVSLYCDVHGHSRKKNIFMYGCWQNSTELEGAKNNALIKVIPSMFSEKNKNFSYRDCRFAMEKEKEATARIVLFRELDLLASYTLEVSFFGSD
jgi:murein tripeptide amidase MpaA